MSKPHKLPAKSLLSGESMQTVAFGSLGLACVAFMSFGGVFVIICLALALGCAALIILLHWKELASGIDGGRFSRSLALPVAVAMVVTILGISMIFKDELAPPVLPDPNITVTDIVPTKLDPTDAVRFNVYYKNGDNIIAGLNYHHAIATSAAPISAAQEDKIFQHLETLGYPSKDASNIIGRSELFYTTLPNNARDHTVLTDAFVADIIAKHQSLYFSLFSAFRRLPDHSLWVVESCQYWDFRTPVQYVAISSPHRCVGHNGVFRVTAKGVDYAHP